MPHNELRTVYRHEIKVIEADNVRGFGASIDRKADDILALALDVEARGLLEPIVVRQVVTQYEVLDGFRRMAACDLVGMPVVPVSVVPVTDPVEILAIRCAANGGKPLTPAELGFVLVAMEKAALEQGVTLDQITIAKKVGIGKDYVNRLLQCAKRLIPPALEAWKGIGGARISTDQALDFARLSPADQARKWKSFADAGGLVDLDVLPDGGQRKCRRTAVAIGKLASELDEAKQVRVGSGWEPASDHDRQIMRAVLSWVLSPHVEKPIR